MSSLRCRRMTKRKMYILLVLLLGSAAQGESAKRTQKRRLGEFPILQRALNFFMLDDEETEEAIRLRHDSGPFERDADVTPTQPTRFPTMPPTIRPTNAPIPGSQPPTELPTISPGDDTDSPTINEGGSNAPTILPSSSPSTLPSISAVPTPLGGEPASSSPSVSPGDNTDSPTDSQQPSSGGEEPSVGPSASSAPSFVGGFTLESFLTETLTDDGSLTTEGTPQNLAFEALGRSNPELNPNDPIDQIQISQRYALNTLYFSTEGETWTNNNLWTSSSPLCGADVETSWHGVVCDLVGLQVVERLILPGNDLFGTIPSEIRGLTNLSK